MKLRFIIALLLLVSCEVLDNDPQKHVVEEDKDSTAIALEEVAYILSSIPLSHNHYNEVYTAVTSSSDNGYDEEYTMTHLLNSPGAGVGEDLSTRSGAAFERPLRDLIKEYVYSEAETRTSAVRSLDNPDEFIKQLEASDMQIYWPFSENWDGHQPPLITFDPEDGSDVNIGYVVSMKDDGSRHVEEVQVDEEMARVRPVWVVNRNSDAGYTTLELLRRDDPDWGEGGGSIIVKPSAISPPESKSSSEALGMLVLKEFTMNRNYDSWFAGASEFFVKIASLDDFTASTEAELRLYNPLITDFMIVVKRSQVGIPQEFNVMLVSEMKRHMIHSSSCDGDCSADCHYEYDEYAFMISEDDGGTKEDWNCKAKVFVAGKSYGVEVSIPLSTRDDIVWRGMLTGKSLERFNNKVNHFGDVDLKFEIVEY